MSIMVVWSLFTEWAAPLPLPLPIFVSFFGYHMASYTNLFIYIV